MTTRRANVTLTVQSWDGESYFRIESTTYHGGIPAVVEVRGTRRLREVVTALLPEIAGESPRMIQVCIAQGDIRKGEHLPSLSGNVEYAPFREAIAENMGEKRFTMPTAQVAALIARVKGDREAYDRVVRLANQEDDHDHLLGGLHGTEDGM